MSKLSLKPGQRFGRLTVIGPSAPSTRKRFTYLLRCDCGNYSDVTSGDLKANRIVSCGCHRREALKQASVIHGKTETAEYRAWCGMKGRCGNQNNSKYPEYGGRGIRVCDRWLNSFENFYTDLGPRPSPRHSIDRIDVNGNYEKANCRWTIPREQRLNQRRRNNDRQLAEQATANGRVAVPLGTIYSRLKRGVPLETAMSRPFGRKKSDRLVTFAGETRRVSDWAKRINVTYAVMAWRLKHWTLERALTATLRPYP